MANIPNNTAPSVLAAWNARIIFSSITFAFCIGIIILTTVWGKGDNTLHSNAQSWAFALMGAILLGFGSVAALETFLDKRK